MEVKIGKDMKDLERVIVSQSSNLQSAMITVLGSHSNRQLDEIVDALRCEKHNNATSSSNGDNH